MGIDATVQREQVKGETSDRANNKLREIGEGLNPLADHLKHMGSGAVHVYYNKNLQQVYIVSQTNTMQDMPEVLAQHAAKDFIGTLMETFGKRRPKLRSGF